MIPAGKLNRQMILESPTTAADEYGENLGIYEEMFTVWCAIEPIAPREVQVAQSFALTVSHKITMRYRSYINNTHRLRMGARVFEINGLINPNDANEDTICFCTEVI